MKSSNAQKQGTKEKENSSKTAKSSQQTGFSAATATGSATQKTKAKSGHGLTDEGTNVSYNRER